MNNENSKKINLIKMLVLIIIIIICCIAYKDILVKNVAIKEFAEDMTKMSEENKNPIFRINKIVLYASADIIDNSTGEEALKDFNIQQFTDIAIYIDNRNTITELSLENTVKELYIDNIRIESKTNQSNQVINYKSPLNIAKYRQISDVGEEKKIDFRIYKTNEQKEKGAYEKAAFFTDCSDPISLGYINKDIVKNCSLTENTGVVAFNGTMLQNANVDLESISSIISFRINLKNNLDEDFKCLVTIDNDLTKQNKAIYNGNLTISEITKGVSYNFFKL